MDGDINCEEFEANVTGSSFKNIYGESITFHKGNSISSKSTIDEIAATKIDIENVKVNKVSGEFVIIGDDCIVELVEYNNTLSISKKAKITRIVKMSDLYHNMDLTRLDKITDEDLQRVKKYHKAYKYLSNGKTEIQ